MKKNERNAGRKPNGYETKTLRVPVDLIPTFSSQIAEYKLKGDDNAKHDPTKTSE